MDGRTDRITTPKTALAQLRRAVKIGSVCPSVCATVSTQSAIAAILSSAL